jgi:isoleucyl-tRNA synthetase
MKLARDTASQGLSARSEAGIKVRQPLDKVLVYVKQGRAELADELVDIVADELNIKTLEFVQDPETLVSFKVFPVNRLLGPKYGNDFPKIKAALADANPDEVAARVQDGEKVVLESGETKFELEPDEIMIRTEAAEGLSTVDSKLLTVAIETTITPALKAEGLARELVRRIQDFRKQAGFDIADRIIIHFQSSSELAKAIDEHRAYIKEETLALELTEAEPEQNMFAGSSEFEGEEVRLGLRVSK